MQTIEESLFQAIKKDDKKAFDALMENTQCGACRLGRFPTLSLLYLYDAKKILADYEEKFIDITSFTAYSEPVEISKKFSSKAGKCLRLYLNEIVSPLEMLLILNKTNRLKRLYPLAKNASSSIKGRLKAIYFIKYSLSIKFEGNAIVIDKRPLNYSEKKKIFNICICVVLALIIFVGGPITAYSILPKRSEGEVMKLSHIDFASQKEYVLKKDIVLPKNFSVEKVNCTINGDGNKLIIGDNATLGELNGSLSNLTIESGSGAIFNSVNENAKIQNVTLNVNAEIETSQGGAFLALKNYGLIEDVTLNASGKITASAPSTNGQEEFAFGGIVYQNNVKSNGAAGTIKNCAVNYSEFSLAGETSANASFGGVAGVNNGYLQNCKVAGEIVADTFDIAGVCSLNNGVVSGNVNEANLSQTSDDTEWNPIVSGIVLTNAYAVENCDNKGKITSKSTCGEFEINEEYDSAASATGIAYLNRSSMTTPFIKNCDNLGDIESTAEYRDIYAAGICISSSGIIERCKNDGRIDAKTANGLNIYVGGIASLAFGDVYRSVNYGAIIATGDGETQAGGISARAIAELSYCFSSGEIDVTAKKVYAGGILGYSDIASAYTMTGISIYVGSVDYCISESKLTVNTTGDGASYVGGITGYVKEQGFNNDEIFFGGCVTNSYFMGEYLSYASYFGNIVGVCGANVYEKNSYTTDSGEFYNFGGNYYLDNGLKSFGATLKGEDKFVAVDGKGAASATVEFIKNSENYKSILAKIPKSL